MKNKSLAIFSQAIPYFKRVRILAGTVTATILLQQLEFNFDKPGNEDGFTKDLEPHPNSREGFTWTEEIGFSAEEFTSAFARIGTRYKSKSEFDKALDKFKGKYYCSYLDRVRKTTFYFRNHELLDNHLTQLSEGVFEQKPKQEKSKEASVDPGLQKPGSMVCRNREAWFAETVDPGLHSIYKNSFKEDPEIDLTAAPNVAQSSVTNSAFVDFWEEPIAQVETAPPIETQEPEPIPVKAKVHDPEPPSCEAPPKSSELRQKSAARRVKGSAATIAQTVEERTPSTGKKRGVGKKKESWVLSDDRRRPFTEVWNAEKPPKYAPIGLDDSYTITLERRVLRALVDHTLEAHELDWRDSDQLEQALVLTLDMLRGALRWAANDEFYCSKDFSLQQLAGNNKIQDLYSKFAAAAAGIGALPKGLEKKAIAARYEAAIPQQIQRIEPQQSPEAIEMAEWNSFWGEVFPGSSSLTLRDLEKKKGDRRLAREFEEWKAKLESEF